MRPLLYTAKGVALKLDHIAIVVADLEVARRDFEARLGLVCERVEDVPAEQASVAFFDLGGVHLELVAPMSPESSLGRSLEKRGEGMHHLCFEVEHLDATIAAIEASGMTMATRPGPGARGSRVAFVHPRSLHGVLIELVEKPKEPKQSEGQRMDSVLGVSVSG